MSDTEALGDDYGFPAWRGRGIKIGRTTQAPFGDFDIDVADLRALLARHLPGLGAPGRGAAGV
ncbi:hypothetical protein V5738_02070 [Salinisphaera sp. SPP-AMP-43]|uniref:hypothetical protein n=1 Tax=Salinisphaera sp. SPP-AMP-43 TaxID=3121288 RepID=UPI003C6E270D